MPRKTLFAALFATLFATQVAWASPREEMLYYRDGMRVDPVEVSRILAGPGLKRSIRLLPPGKDEATSTVAMALPVASPVAAATVELAPVQQPASVALPVQFAFDSAEILPRAREQLDAMAEGIKMLPESHKVLIEGHTDGRGSNEYNLQLSRKRAEAVKRYLVVEHGLDAQRLRTIGYGEDRPIDGFDSMSPENRRVQFRGA